MSQRTEQDIKAVCYEIQELLIEKNRAYGDSALNPRRTFPKANAIEQIRVRLDDKLSRIESAPEGGDAFGEDVELDLLGYLVLHRIARLRAREVPPLDPRKGRTGY